MAIRFAVATGNWSNPAIWDDGIGPVVGDAVFANGRTVTIDQNINVASIRNDSSIIHLPALATPAMTSNSTPSGLAYASGSAAGSQPYFAFAQDGPTNNWYSNVNNTGWLAYQFPSAKTIRRYGFSVLGSGYSGGSNTPPAAWTFQGSNDGSTWTTLDTQTGQILADFSFNSWVIASPASFTYYRINITATKGAGFPPAINEFQMTESTGTVFGTTTGGGYILNGGITATLTTTTPLVGQTSLLLTYSAAAGNTSVINCTNSSSLIYFNFTAGVNLINHTGAGTLTINAATMTETNIGNNNNNGITISGGGTLNYNGNLTISVPYTSKQFIAITSAATVNFTGNLNVVISGSANIGSQLITCSSAGATINIIGNIVTSGNNTQATSTSTAISASAGTINMTGSITGSTVSFTNQNIVNLSGGANFYLTGSITGGSNFNMLSHTGTGIISITGPVTATGNSVCITTSAGSVLTVTGTCTASASNVAVACSAVASSNTFTGPFISNNNWMAVAAARIFLTTTPTYWRFQSDARTMYTADYAPGYPAPGNVRSGVSYNGGLMTGTMIVPPAGSVTFGVPVDGTTGTAALTTAAVQNAVFDKLISTLTTPNSIGVRISNSLTADSLGNLLSSL